jgi:hypothetical protein
MASRPFIDVGPAFATTILTGMGRSGTTWATDIINYDGDHRVIFEPFFPARVKEASGLEYIEYVRPSDTNEALLETVGRILSGGVKSQWVDRDNDSIFYRKRIVKSIRANLMLGWIAKNFPEVPVVLMIRHPLQVAASWLKLDWGEEVDGERTDFEILVSQDELLADFPIIDEAKDKIDTESVLERTVFEWCVLYTVPFQLISDDRMYVLRYEDVVTEPKETVCELFQYLGIPFEWNRTVKSIGRASSTNFQNRDYSRDTSELLEGWKESLSMKQIETGKSILSVLEMSELYEV